MKKFLLFLFILTTGIVCSQNLDSLQNEIDKMGNDTNAIIALDKLSHQYALDNLDAAFLCANAAFEKSKFIPTGKIKIVAEYNLAIIYSDKSNYIQALFHLINAEKKSEQAKDLKMLAACYNSIGNCYALQKQSSTAMNFYKKSLSLCQQLNYTKKAAAILGNMGNLVYEKSDNDKRYLDSAIPYYTKAYQQDVLNKDTILIVSMLNSLALVHSDLRNFSMAKQYLSQSKKLIDLKYNADGLLNYYNYMGRVVSYEKNNKDALLYYDSCITVAKEVGDIGSIANAYGAISDVGSETADYKMAYENFVRFKKINDSIMNAENFAQASDFQNRYEREKKEQEHKLLQQENRQNKLTSYFTAVGLLIALIFAFFIFRGLKAQRKANSIISKQKEEVHHQKELIEEKQKEILDSIHYAKRIQRAMITSDTYISQYVKDYFIFYQPKDIVSGDFYWALETNNKFYLVTADCTGHGVPGAFMSLLNISILNEVMIEKKTTRPDFILNEARKDIIKALNPKGSEESKDGMDCILACFDFDNLKLQYAAANNSFYIVRNNELLVCKADKMPIGKSPTDEIPFTYNEIQLQKNDTVYMLTDGLPDQFGGAKGKKYKYKQLEDMLIANSQKTMQEQKQLLEKSFNDWKGQLEQVDDVLLIGIKL